jgi:hypothetical protein
MYCGRILPCLAVEQLIYQTSFRAKTQQRKKATTGSGGSTSNLQLFIYNPNFCRRVSVAIYRPNKKTPLFYERGLHTTMEMFKHKQTKAATQKHGCQYY